MLLNGSCHAPGGKPTTRVTVALQVGSLTKSFNVVGNRTYKAGLLYRTVGEPEPFTVMPISYNNAFGGVDKPDEDPKTHQWYPLNHAGVGYHPGVLPKALDGKPLPNTEEIGHAVSKSNGSYKPMAFGPVGRRGSRGSSGRGRMTRSGWTRRSHSCRGTSTSATSSAPGRPAARLPHGW